jgi:hypothetical protein
MLIFSFLIFPLHTATIVAIQRENQKGENQHGKWMNENGESESITGRAKV